MATAVLYEGVEFRLYDHLYGVSSSGDVLRMKPHPHLIAPRRRKDGYLDVGRRRLAHRMVATCWVERPDEAKHVHHINHDKSDNRACNLQWLTPKQHIGEKHEPKGRYVRTAEIRQKLRNYRTGRKTSEETKAKQRAASLRLGSRPPRPILGYTHSEEARAKMRRNASKNTPCIVMGVVYPSFAEAGKALGVKLHTLRKRCLSNSFPEYTVLGDTPR